MTPAVIEAELLLPRFRLLTVTSDDPGTSSAPSRAQLWKRNSTMFRHGPTFG